MAKRAPVVREAAPVQVYLDPDDQDRLERLAAQLEVSKSDVLRRGLDALERAVTDPATHPALRLIGLAEEQKKSGRTDAARQHDKVLADEEEKSWSGRGR
jgi:hypothetical protein